MLQRAFIRPALILLASLSLAVSVLAAFPAYHAEAAPGFNPANIIDDKNFYTSSPTMTVEEIQKFLNVQGAKCVPSGGVPCLKDFKQTTKSRPADAYCPKPYQGAANESAATIIWKTSNACNIAPQVILVTLQKEQSLVTSTVQGASGYRTAMGYGCPDFAACDANYYGFANQVYNAARQMQRYKAQPGSFNFAAGRTSYIQYNPAKSCGGTHVKVQNAATAALYNYTPYQPGGRGGCETYGNNNFWKFYNAWFGDPHVVKKAQPAAKPVAPQANTQAPTGTRSATAEQVPQKEAQAKKEAIEKKEAAAKDKASEEQASKKEAANDQAVKVEPLSLSLEDAQGNALQKDKGVSAGAELTVKVSNLDAKAKPVVKVDGVDQKAEVKAAADSKAVIEVKITAPGKAENHTVSVSQVGEDGKALETKKDAEAHFWVFYADPTVMAVTTEDNVVVADGGKVLPGKKLAVKVGGLKPDTTPAIGYVSAKDKEDQKKINVSKVNGLGIVEFALTAPEKLGKYNIVVPGVDESEGTSFTFEVIEDTEKIKAEQEAQAKAEAEKAAKEKADAEAAAKAAAEAEAKKPPVFLGAKRQDGTELKSGAEVEQGEKIVLQLSGLIPNEKPLVTMHSNPIVLPTGKADAKGNLTVSFAASAEPGEHQIKVDKLAGKGEPVTVLTFKVRAPIDNSNATQTQSASTHMAASSKTSQLAETGQATAPLLALMIMLVGTGLAVTSYARARQPISVN